MVHDDVNIVDEVWRAALAPLMADRTTPVKPRTEREQRTDLARFHHLVSTDPMGAFVATENERIVGICQSSRRGSTFLLSRLGVTPDFQDRRIGRELLARALAYGDGCAEQYIFTSRDPRAIHTYLREGFELHPCIQLVGRPHSLDVAASIRLGSSSDLELIDSIDRSQRGVTRRADLSLWFELGADVFIDEDGGYLIFDGTRLLSLCARAEDVATRLLTAALGGAFGHPPLEAGWIVQEQRWAIDCAVASRASVAIRGAILTRYLERFAVPYLPNASLG